jgi:hypothetical protein
MFENAINKETRRVFTKIGASELAPIFYLAGGTALAIQLGHRESIDLDWFSQADYDAQIAKRFLAVLGNFTVLGESSGTIHGTIDDVKVSFLRYQYPLLFPLIEYEGISLADERDIAAMKIDAISSRGSKKDFIDLFFLLKEYSLQEILEFFTKKYNNINYNLVHIIKSLSFFEDSEEDPEPVMLKKANWEDVKKEISRQAQEYLKI